LIDLFDSAVAAVAALNEPSEKSSSQVKQEKNCGNVWVDATTDSCAIALPDLWLNQELMVLDSKA